MIGGVVRLKNAELSPHQQLCPGFAPELAPEAWYGAEGALVVAPLSHTQVGTVAGGQAVTVPLRAERDGGRPNLHNSSSSSWHGGRNWHGGCQGCGDTSTVTCRNKRPAMTSPCASPVYGMTLEGKKGEDTHMSSPCDLYSAAPYRVVPPPSALLLATAAQFTTQHCYSNPLSGPPTCTLPELLAVAAAVAAAAVVVTPSLPASAAGRLP